MECGFDPTGLSQVVRIRNQNVQVNFGISDAGAHVAVGCGLHPHAPSLIIRQQRLGNIELAGAEIRRAVIAVRLLGA